MGCYWAEANWGATGAEGGAYGQQELLAVAGGYGNLTRRLSIWIVRSKPVPLRQSSVMGFEQGGILFG